jgi:hypothetical protein
MKRSVHLLLTPVLFMLLMACNPTIQTTFKLTAQDLTLAQGASGAINIGIERDASDTTPIDLVLEQADGQALPADLRGTFSPTPSTGISSSLNILAGSSLAAKTYDLQVKGSTTSGSVQTVAFKLIVETAKTFALSIDPANLSLAQGASGTVSVTLTRTNLTDPIDVSLQGTGAAALPDGISAVFTASATGGSLSITVASSAIVKENALEVKAVGGGITKTTPLLLTVTAPGVSDLTLELNPIDLTVTQGLSGNVAVTITRTNLSGDAVISLQGTGGAALPTGVSPAGTTITGTGTTDSLAINVAASTTVGNYNLEVKAVSGSITKVKPLTLKVIAPIASDFSIVANPVTLSLEQGKSGNAGVNITRTNFTSDITLSLQGQGGAAVPTGINAPNSTSSSNTGTLNITVAASVAANNYPLEIKAVSGSVTKTTAFTLTVTPKPVPADFTLSSDPASLSLAQGKSGTVAITIVRTNLSETINVGLQGLSGVPLPTGIGSSFVSNASGGILTVNIADTTAVGSYNLEIKGEGAGVVKTKPLTVNVTPKPDLVLTPSAPGLTIEPTYSGDVGITLTRTALTDVVTISLLGSGGAPLPAGISAAPINITGNTGTLNIAVANTVGAQTTELQIKAVGGGVTKTATLSLTTLAAPFAVNKSTQTILDWASRVGQIGDFLSATSNDPTIANYQTTIDATGLVSYDLPVPTVLSAPSTLLATYCTNGTQNLVFSSSTVKGSERQFGAPSPGKYGSLVLSNKAITTPPVLGLEQAFVVYLDGDVNVTGTCQGTTGAIVNVTVNAQLKLGWNILVGKITTIGSGALGAIGVEVTSRTTVPASYSWRYYPR